MIHPVILCGGAGTRLWPVSRQDYPKQFAKISGQKSLFQACLTRLRGRGFAPPLILTHKDFRFLAREQVAEAGAAPARVLLEPCRRDTGPAALVAALDLAARGMGDHLMILAPSDHVIRDAPAFRTAITGAAEAARQGRFVCFGVPPDHPETGYGYLELPTPFDAGAPPHVRNVVRFIEKPGPARAGRICADGRHLWNAGLFLCRVDDLIAAFARLAPRMTIPCRAAMATAHTDLGFLRIGAEAYRRAPAGSIDRVVMEKAGNLSVMPLRCGWSDMGGWETVRQEMGPDAAGMAQAGNVMAMGCRETLLRAEQDGPLLVGIGLEGLAVVAMRDAVLVADRGHLQQVRQAVAALKQDNAPEGETLPRHHRPWGWYETLAEGPRFQVKKIVVPPGRRLSLQSHVHRAEHWIVVAGVARVSLDGRQRLVSENQSVYIPPGARHRLENPGKVDLSLIEVQTGAYLGEDDIVRYQDAYGRVCVQEGAGDEGRAPVPELAEHS